MRDLNPSDDLGGDRNGRMPVDLNGDLSHRDIDHVSREFDVEYLSASNTQAHDAKPFRGRVGVQCFHSGLSVCTSDVSVQQFTKQAALIPRSASIAMLLEGSEINARLSHSSGMQMRAGSAIAVNLADTERMSSEVGPGVRARTIILRCTPDTILDEELSTAVLNFTRRTQIEALPFSRRAHRLAEDVMRMEGSGLSRRLLTESFALEMLAGMVSYLTDRPANRDHRLSQRDRARLSLVHDMIQHDPGADHSLIALARACGMSVSSLKRKFPKMFGCSIGAYVRDARLEKAREGLVDEGWSVAQAAHMAGYAHISNFTAAFRRRFGTTPGVYKRL